MTFRRFIQSSWSFFKGSSIASIYSFIAMLVLGKTLGLTDFGKLALLMAIAASIEGLCYSQSWQVVLRYWGENKNIVFATKRIDKINIVLSLFSCLIALLLTEFFDLDFYLMLLILMPVPLRVLGTYYGVARVTEKFHYISQSMQLSSASKLVAAFLSYIYDIDLVCVVAIFSLGEIVSLGILYFRCDKYLTSSNLAGGIKINTAVWKFSIITHFNASSVLLIRHIDEIVVAKALGFKEAAVYKLIKMVTVIISKLIEPMYLVIYPEITKLVNQKEWIELISLLKKVTILSFATTMLFIMGQILMSGYFLNYYVGDDSQYYSLIIYTIGFSINLMFFYAHPLAIATFNEVSVLKANIVLGIAYLLCLQILIGYYGLLGVAFSVFLYTLASALTRLVISFRYIRVRRNG